MKYTYIYIYICVCLCVDDNGNHKLRTNAPPGDNDITCDPLSSLSITPLWCYGDSQKAYCFHDYVYYTLLAFVRVGRSGYYR